MIKMMLILASIRCLIKHFNNKKFKLEQPNKTMGCKIIFKWSTAETVLPNTAHPATIEWLKMHAYMAAQKLLTAKNHSIRHKLV